MADLKVKFSRALYWVQQVSMSSTQRDVKLCLAARIWLSQCNMSEKDTGARTLMFRAEWHDYNIMILYLDSKAGCE